MDNVKKTHVVCGESSLAQSDDLELFQKSRPPFLFLRLLSNLFARFISRRARRPQSRQRHVIRRR